jgi:hypothetical protein
MEKWDFAGASPLEKDSHSTWETQRKYIEHSDFTHRRLGTTQQCKSMVRQTFQKQVDWISILLLFLFFDCVSKRQISNWYLIPKRQAISRQQYPQSVLKIHICSLLE